MRDFFLLTGDEQFSALSGAKRWRAKHELHVSRLVASGTSSYPPSGSDAFRPELWKPAMWRWLATLEQRQQ